MAKHYALEFSIKRYLKREQRSSLLFETAFMSAFAFNAFKCTFWLFLHVRKRRRKSVMHYSQLEQSSPRQPLSHWQRSGATQRPWTHSLVQRATHTHRAGMEKQTQRDEKYKNKPFKTIKVEDVNLILTNTFISALIETTAALIPPPIVHFHHLPIKCFIGDPGEWIKEPPF